MKSLKLAMAALLSLAATSAHADIFQLNFINTNNCERATSLIRLLTNSEVRLTPVCHGPGHFPSDQGPVYTYRVVTTLETRYPTAPQQVIELDQIYVNDCDFPRKEIALLESAQINIRTQCSPPGQYISGSGQIYRHKIRTQIKRNF